MLRSDTYRRPTRGLHHVLQHFLYDSHKHAKWSPECELGPKEESYLEAQSGPPTLPNPSADPNCCRFPLQPPRLRAATHLPTTNIRFSLCDNISTREIQF